MGASLLAIAIFGLVVLGTFRTGVEERLVDVEMTSLERTQLETQLVNLAAAEPPPSLEPAAAARVRHALAASFEDGYRRVMLLAVALALLSSAVAATTIGRRPARAS